MEDLERASSAARRDPKPSATTRLLELKTQAHDWVRATEKIWDFYFELFGQRQSTFGEWLVACDRIALDCYQHVYMHLGSARSIPAPPPFAYMRTGFSPATFRRGIPLRRLGRQLNPFPLVQLPTTASSTRGRWGQSSTRSATTCRTSCSWNAWSHWRSCAGSARRRPRRRRAGVGPLEPRDLRRHAR